MVHRSGVTLGGWEANRTLMRSNMDDLFHGEQTHLRATLTAITISSIVEWEWTR